METICICACVKCLALVFGHKNLNLYQVRGHQQGWEIMEIPWDASLGSDMIW